MLTKYTDFPRIHYLLRAFPRAQFIRVTRDPHSVATSFYRRMNKREFGTWDDRTWWSKAWPASWRDDFQSNHFHPLGLAAYLTLYFIKLLDEESSSLAHNQLLRIDYEKLTRDPGEAMRRILGFCGLREWKRVRG